jgi:transposase
LHEYRDTVDETERRLERLTEQLRQLAPTWRWAPVVAALQALRGVSFITAVALIAELGDLTRFAHPRELMAYLGLVLSEHSSGPSVRRGAITKAGNPHVRRLLAEAAWAYHGIPRIGRVARLRSRVSALIAEDPRQALAGRLVECFKHAPLTPAIRASEVDGLEVEVDGDGIRATDAVYARGAQHVYVRVPSVHGASRIKGS